MTPEQWLEKHYPVPASALSEATDTDTCALCEKYLYDYACKDIHGKDCPIVRMQGIPCCFPLLDSIYHKSEKDPAPMIDLLKRTLEFVRNGG